MGSLEVGVPIKKDQQSLGRAPSSRSDRQHRPRSRFSKFLLSKRIGYLQWISTIVVFSVFLVLFQAFLPGSVVERPGKSRKDLGLASRDLLNLKQIGGLDFGEDVKFEPRRLLDKFKKENGEVNVSDGSKRGVRFAYRKPQLALVFADLEVDPYQILMATVAAALQETGYRLEVFSSNGGPAHAIWGHVGVPVTIISTKDNSGFSKDWLNYDGILVNSLEAKGIVASLMQEPFKSIPLIWTIHETTLASRLRHYTSSGMVEVLNDWKKSFNRATVTVFPNYVLPISYSTFDAGNYFVIPATSEAWEADILTGPDEEQLRIKMGFGTNDFVIAIVGSPFLYKGLWLEQALVLEALMPLLDEFPPKINSSSLKIFVLTGDSTSNYSLAVEAISTNLKYPKGIVMHASGDGIAEDVLRTASLVIYGSFLEQSFPDILIKAMCLGKLTIAPNLSMIRKYIDDRVNGYLFPKEDIKVLTEIMSQVVSRGKLSPHARNVASIGKETAKNMMVLETIEGYASVLENILRLPSEVISPKAIVNITSRNKKEWQWNNLTKIRDLEYKNRTSSSYAFLDRIEEEHNHTKVQSTVPKTPEDEAYLYSIWEEHRETEMAYTRKRREDEELKGRSDRSRGAWEDVYRNAKRADRLKNDLHERDDGELERTGQPLCIYEPYFGEGTWPFLHLTSLLYRGISLATRGRRTGSDDIDASSRLPLLVDPYYRDVLGEFGAFFAIANRVDRVHKNAWIGFESWRATAKKATLSNIAQKTLLNTIEKRRHGDALYFWARMDLDPRNPSKLDFWSFCDTVNAGNCRSAFSDVLGRMYGIKHELDHVPPMPSDGDSWSVMHSWALPTRSFLEFVMFARMFVDTLDAQMYEEHHESGRCYLSLSKDKHCYARVLELLVNVWAYHSARRMIYIDPETGAMQEQHKLKTRTGQMWVKWFTYPTLKSMDEDLAEEADSDRPKRRWLWPRTGEVFWQGMYEKERNQRQREKEKKKQKSREKIGRIKSRTHQKALGKYVKPLPEELGSLNSTVGFTGR